MNSIITWFAKNGVAANLLVTLIAVAGLLSSLTLKREIFPEFESDVVTVSVQYLGAAPEEVEEGVCIRIEEAIQGLEQIKRITSRAAEGLGTVTVELLPGSDIPKALDEIKNQVDAIDTFPEETEKPLIQQFLLTKQVINIALSGDVDEATLKTHAERVRDELTALPGITQARLANARPYEIAIEVSEQDLRRFGLTFDEVARAVRRSSIDLPGGSVRTRGGEILIRTKGQAYRGEDFEDIVLRNQPDGSRLLVGDVARVVDGFAETDQSATFDGKPAVIVQVFRVGDQNALEISRLTQEYASKNLSRLPEGITMTTWQDDASYLRSRINLLVRNGIGGLILVFIVLAMFLRFRLAIWVSFGLVISFLGTLWLMPALGVSINLLSLFAFILVLGIVVDDAIVVSENIYAHQERHEGGLQGAISGTHEVLKPVIFAVLTTVAAFLPLVSVPGNTGKVINVIPFIVIPTLLFSLVECLFVLPTHLSHLKPVKSIVARKGILGLPHRFQRGFAGYVDRFINRVYSPLLGKALHNRYLTLSAAAAILIFTFGIVGGGWIRFVFFPAVEGDNVAAMLTMPLGTPASVTREAVQKIESSALRLRDQIDAATPKEDPSVFHHVLASVASQPYLDAQRQGAGQFVSASGAHLGEVHIELAPSEERSGSSTDIASQWRELTGSIPDAIELVFTASIFTSGDPINIQLAGLHFDQLRQTADQLKTQLRAYQGVTGISDSFREGKQEVKLQIKPSAEALGLSLSDLGRQVRQGFYGEEAQRIQRGRDELRVMVRYPEEERRSLGDLEGMRIRTPQGDAVPFSAVADATLGRGYASIKRVDRKRAINVTADVDPTKGNTQQILMDLKESYLPQLARNNPGISYSFEGEQREQQETVQGILAGYPLAMLIIYALLAIPFRSYLQPFIVMSAIPFGFVGAVWGHVIMGMDLTILSMFGIVALSGVVVNDNLVLVDFINRARQTGVTLHQAVRTAGVSRFRPIILTSLTTFAGLTPLLLEPSVQAKFLVPMAISLGFGVMFATAVSLLLVPASYLILEDLHRLLHPGPSDRHIQPPPTPTPSTS